MISITPRLKAAAELGSGARRIIDVGCDHGFLTAYMLSRGAEYAYACDINRGPLQKAAETIAKEGLESRTELRLTDGLCGFSGAEADTLFICGMGGELIASILAKAEWCADGKHTLVLQPMSRSAHLRAFLYENGFHIVRERITGASGRLYCVMRACGGAGDCGQNNRFLFSETMRAEPLFREYIKTLIDRQRTVLHGMELAQLDRSRELEVMKILEDAYAD